MHAAFSSDSISNIAPALLNVQQALRPLAKDAENPFLRNRYTSFATVLESIRPILTENSLILIQRGIEAQGNALSVETRIIHAPSGEWISGVITLPMPEAEEELPDTRRKGMGANIFQLYGAGLSYGKRYGLMSLLALSSVDEDTDGEYRQDIQPQAPTHRTPQPTAAHSSYPPAIQGVTYQETQDSQGRKILLARGSTLENKNTLKNYGFRWDGSSRTWWCYAG